VDPTGMNNEALLSASANGHTEVVRLLLADPRVDPTVGYSSLKVAQHHGHLEIVELLKADSRITSANMSQYQPPELG